MTSAFVGAGINMAPLPLEKKEKGWLTAQISRRMSFFFKKKKVWRLMKVIGPLWRFYRSKWLDFGAIKDFTLLSSHFHRFVGVIKYSFWGKIKMI